MKHLYCECCRYTCEEVIVCAECKTPVCRNCAIGEKCVDCYYDELSYTYTVSIDGFDKGIQR